MKRKQPYKAHIESGRIRVNSKQTKKHRTQLSDGDLSRIRNQLNTLSIEHHSISKHLLKKRDSFPIHEFAEVIQSFSDGADILIELNKTETSFGIDYRILLRGVKSYRTEIGNAQLCLVFSLIKNEVITAYWNRSTDSHKTIRWERYDASLIIPNFTKE